LGIEYQAIPERRAMTTAQKLRPVAKAELQADNVVEIDGLVGHLKVGIRFEYPYLRDVIRAKVLKEPDGSFAHVLYIAGIKSRQPDQGHGFILLFLDRIQIPWTDWSARDRGETPQSGMHTIPLSEPTISELQRLVNQAHLEHLERCLKEFNGALQAVWWTGQNISAVKDFCAAVDMNGTELVEDGSIQHLRSWVEVVLMHSLMRVATQIPL
jgi:hypothetical protein